MNSGIDQKQKNLYPKNCANFHEFWGETTKRKGSFLQNLQIFAKFAKKQFLLTNFGVITSILGVSGLELHSSDTEPVTFFGGTTRLGGTTLIWGVRPWNAPPWRRACNKPMGGVKPPLPLWQRYRVQSTQAGSIKKIMQSSMSIASNRQTPVILEQ